MNDQLPPDDSLARAARALRDASEARTGGSPSQRGQILARAHANQQSAERRAAVGMALSAVLVTSTAIAAATGNLPNVVAVVQRAVGLAPAEAPVTPYPDAEPASGPNRKLKIARPLAEAPAAEPVADAAPAPLVEPAAIPEPPAVAPPAPPAPEPPAAEVVRAPKPRPSVEVAHKLDAPQPAPAAGLTRDPTEPPDAKPSPGPNEPPPAAAQPAPPAAASVPPPPDETLVLFRSAQALQFRDKAYGKALAGWEAYLRAAPAGALAPEARWNRAVCLLRLGRKPEARIALEPFAQGMEGGYRQAEAAKLIAAMQEGEP